MKKVLYITNLPAPYKISFFNLLSKDVDLTVVFERAHASDRNKKWLSCKGGDYKEIFLHGREIGNESSLSFEIIKVLRQNQYDIVIMNGYSSPTSIIAISYMKFCHIKYAIACDGMLPSVDTKYKHLIKKFLIKDASCYLSSGKITDELLIKYGAEANQIYRYPFSSVLEKDIVSYPFEKEKYKKRVGCTSKTMLLFVGQFIERKGLDILFKSISELNIDFELFMVGGTMENAKGFNGYDSQHIRYCGFKTRDELLDYYKAADILVLPTREDIWGLVVNEAMACGLPVITTEKCGAGLEMINHGQNGFLQPISDFNLKKVLYKDIDSISKMAIKTASQYTIELMEKAFYSVIEDI